MESQETTRWVESLDIQPPDASRTLQTLSGGNQQKAVLAKWLMARPRVMVIDEPTNGVDAPARQRLYEIIRSEAARGVAFILCSSDIQELAEISTRVLVLHEDQPVTESGSGAVRSTTAERDGPWRRPREGRRLMTVQPTLGVPVNHMPKNGRD